MGERFAAVRQPGHRVFGAKAAPGLKEAPGRKIGQTVGSWISDLSELRKAIVLCFTCQHGFDYKRNHYYKDRKFPVVHGRCDGPCRSWTNHGTLFIHESFLADSPRRLRPGQSWTPR